MPRPKQYVVQLSQQQRNYLLRLVRKGQDRARKLTRARVLLLSDEGKSDAFTPKRSRSIPRRCATCVSAFPRKACRPSCASGLARARNRSSTPMGKRS